MREFKHITMEDRREIERLYNAGVKPTEIAQRIGVHHATIYRELRSGDTGAMDANGRIGYSAEIAQGKIYNRRRLMQQAASTAAEGGGAQ